MIDRLGLGLCLATTILLYILALDRLVQVKRPLYSKLAPNQDNTQPFKTKYVFINIEKKQQSWINTFI